jgi:hypothetical protein
MKGLIIKATFHHEDLYEEPRDESGSCYYS